MLEFDAIISVPTGIRCLRHQNQGVGGDGVRISQHFDILTALMNANQEKTL